MGKPVVMHLIAAMDIAGAEKVILNLLGHKENSSYELRVTSFVRVSDDRGTQFLKAVTDMGTISDRLPAYRGWDLGDIKVLKKIIRRHNVKLLHTHGYKSDIVGICGSKLSGIPIVATSHGYTGTRGKLLRSEILDRIFLRFANKVICVSENVKESLVKSGVSTKKIVLLPNSVDFSYLRLPADINYRTIWGVRKGDIIIGSAGRLSSEKAHVNLIKAVAQFPEAERTKIIVVIAGEGPEKEAILEEARKAGIESNLILTGFLADMRSFYQSIDIFCLPSLTEGFPLAILEAAASSKPIVASKVGAIGNLITDGFDGYTLDAGDVSALARTLITLSKSDKMWESLGVRLCEKLMNVYDSRLWAQKVFSIYDEVLNNEINKAKRD